MRAADRARVRPSAGARAASGAAASARPADRAWHWPTPALALVHLVVLWSFAVAQPIFDELEHNAEFFVARGNTSGDIVLLAFGLVLLPPVAMWLVELVALAVWRPLGRAIHAGLVWLLAAATAIGVLRRLLPDTSAALLPAAAGVGAAVTVAYLRAPAMRLILSVLAIAPLVFLAGFLLFSPVSQLVIDKPVASAASAATGRTPVVLAIFDELPTISLMNSERRIDARRTPSFARVAATSTWYRNATTVADGTYVAVPAILTGRRPAERLPTSRSYPNSVFTLVGRGYDVHALEPITHVCPARVCGAEQRDAASERLRSLASDLSVVAGHLVLPHDIAASLPPIDRGYEDFGGEAQGVSAADAHEARAGAIAGGDAFAQRLRDADRYVRAVRRPGRRPPLYMVHFEVPHVPWRLLPSGRQYPVPGPNLPGLEDQTWRRDGFLVGQAMQRHMLQVGYADRMLGRLMHRLRAAGLWDRALVIVTADHGVGLRPGGSRRPVTRADFPGIAGVPLFVKLPGQRTAATDDGAARTVDIVPTIAAVLGATGYPGIDGVPLTSGPADVEPSVRSGRRGRFVSMPLDTFVHARDAELARQRTLLPDGAGVVRAGAGADLAGRAAGAGRDDAAAHATIDEPDSFRAVAPRSGVVPVYLSGHFVRGGQAGMRLAFAVNGRVRAIGRSYRVGSEVRFSALLPAASLRVGRNAIAVLRVRGHTLGGVVARA